MTTCSKVSGDSDEAWLLLVLVDTGTAAAGGGGGGGGVSWMILKDAVGGRGGGTGAGVHCLLLVGLLNALPACWISGGCISTSGSGYCCIARGVGHSDAGVSLIAHFGLTYVGVRAAHSFTLASDGLLGLGHAAAQEPWEGLVHLCTELGMADGVDDGVPDARGLGQHDGDLGHERGYDHVLVRVQHSQGGDCSVGQPGGEEEADGGGSDLCHLHLNCPVFIAVSSLGSHLLSLGVHSVVMGHDGFHNTNIEGEDGQDGKTESEDEHANDKGSILDVLGEIIKAAGSHHAFQVVVAPAKQWWTRPQQSIAPDEHDVAEKENSIQKLTNEEKWISNISNHKDSGKELRRIDQ